MTAEADRADPRPAGDAADAVEGAARAAVTRLGVRDGRAAVVDRAGRLQVGPLTVGWWIGADDRWYRPTVEAVVRQQRLGATPVVETRLRVPGGDVVHRVYGVRFGGAEGGGDRIVAEVENRSRLPLALAVVVGPGTSLSQDAAVTKVDGATILVAPRPPSRLAFAASEDDLFASVVGGRAEELAQLGHHAAGSWLAVLWPVVHTASLRLLVPLDDAGAAAQATSGAQLTSAAPGRQFGVVPSPDQVVRGWHRQLEAGVSLDLPDPALAEAISAGRCELLLGAGAPPTTPQADLGVVRAAARFGHEDAVADGLARLVAAVDRTPVDGGPTTVNEAVEAHAALVSALADAGRFGDGPLARLYGEDDDWTPSIAAAAVSQLDQALRRNSQDEPARRRRYRAALDDAAELLEGAGQQAAAQHVRRLHPAPDPLAMAPPEAGDDAADWTAVQDLLGSASPTWTWADPETGPAFLVAARALLVDDRPPDTLVLLPGWSDSWRGAPVSFVRLPTQRGAVSAALRWHGDRPALLWEIVGPTGRSTTGPPTLTAPALDPAWRATGWRGEALLAPVPIPAPAGGRGEAGDAATFR